MQQFACATRVRVLSFAADNVNYDGWSAVEFHSTAGEHYDYNTIYNALGKVHFIMYAYHAKQSGQGDLNYKGLANSFDQFRFRKYLQCNQQRMCHVVC